MDLKSGVISECTYGDVGNVYFGPNHPMNPHRLCITHHLVLSYELQPYVLDVVKKAETLMLEKGENKEYLPIEGLAAFNKATVELLLGADNEATKQGRVATVQGLSRTDSLRLVASLI